MAHRSLAIICTLLTCLLSFTAAQDAGITYDVEASGTYQLVQWRYQGCYNFTGASIGLYSLANPLPANGADQEQCAELCWTQTTTNTSGIYANRIFFGVASGRRCYCGNQTLTDLVSSDQCFGTNSTPCISNPNEKCGSSTSGAVFLRTDIGGTCQTNGTTLDGYPCFQIDGANRSYVAPLSTSSYSLLTYDATSFTVSALCS